MTDSDSNLVLSQAQAPAQVQATAQAQASAPPSNIGTRTHPRLTHKAPQFSGKKDENPNQFLNQYSWFFKAHNITNDNDKLCSLALSLKGSALVWFNSLKIDPDAEQSMTYKDFCIAFKQHYLIPDICSWHSTVELFSLKQNDLSTHDFVAKVQEVAQTNNCSEQTTLQAIFAGLNPQLRTSILHHEIKSVQDLLYWSKVFETSNETLSTPLGDQSVKAKIDEMHNLLQSSSIVNESLAHESNICSHTCNSDVSSSVKSNCMLVKNKTNNTVSNNVQTRQIIKRCRFCALSHLIGRCPAYSKTCNSCGEKRHYARCCPKRNKLKQ